MLIIIWMLGEISDLILQSPCQPQICLCKTEIYSGRTDMATAKGPSSTQHHDTGLLEDLHTCSGLLLVEEDKTFHVIHLSNAGSESNLPTTVYRNLAYINSLYPFHLPSSCRSYPWGRRPLRQGFCCTFLQH